MFSGKTQSTPIESIIVTREVRQRQDLADIEGMAHSLSTVGQINAIVIDEDMNLVAGERRYTAAKSLGWTHITTQSTADCTPDQLYLIELVENLKRQDLTWQETCRAIYDYHSMMCGLEEEWNKSMTATALGISAAEVSDRIGVQTAIMAGVTLVCEAPKYSTARSAMQRSKQRESASTLANISFNTPPAADPLAEISLPSTEPSDDGAGLSADLIAKLNAAPVTSDQPSLDLDIALPTKTRPPAPILMENFNEWAPQYEGTKFNFLHCDFPYGIDADKHKAGAAKSHGGYADGEDIYWELLRTLGLAMDNVVAESAHMMFWFSMDFYQDTLEALTAMGWTVNPFPLYWVKSCNSGIMPDPKRGPRRVVETAFLCSRGDRFVAQPVSNASYTHATKDFHMSEKPVVMLMHFFRMFVDSSTIMLDPTAGSANAVVTAHNMGAAAVLGLEQIEEFHERACDNWDRFAGEKPA
jgi:hypothetical protein